MKIEEVSIKTLKFDSQNPRKHGKKNLKALKASIMKFGQQKPIVIDENNIVLAGNGTLEAMADLGKKKVFVVRSTLDALKAIQYKIADNRSAELAEWDDEILGQLLLELHEQDADLEALGFDSKDLKKWLGGMDNPGGSDSSDHKPEWLVVVECDDEPHQARVFEMLKEAGERCKIM